MEFLRSSKSVSVIIAVVVGGGGVAAPPLGSDDFLLIQLLSSKVELANAFSQPKLSWSDPSLASLQLESKLHSSSSSSSSTALLGTLSSILVLLFREGGGDDAGLGVFGSTWKSRPIRSREYKVNGLLLSSDELVELLLERSRKLPRFFRLLLIFLVPSFEYK